MAHNFIREDIHVLGNNMIKIINFVAPKLVGAYNIIN